MDNRNIVICSDHAGYKLKEYLKKRLKRDNFNIIDMSGDADQGDDYPDIISKGSEAISSGKYKEGIFICGAGVGASIVANRYKGVRAVLAFNKRAVIFSKEHNNTNVIVFSGWLISFRKAYRFFNLWWNAKFSGYERHIRRINKLDRLGD